MKFKDIKTQEQVIAILDNDENPFYADTQDYPRQMDYALTVGIIEDEAIKVEIETHNYFLNKFVVEGLEEHNVGRVFKAFVDSMKKEDFEKMINNSSKEIKKRLGLVDGEVIDFSNQGKLVFKNLVKNKGAFSVAKVMLNFIAYDHYLEVVQLMQEAEINK